MNLIPVDGENHLFRDATTNAIINTNQSEHSMYIARKKIQEEEKEKISKIENEVHSIKNDIEEIKFLLRNLKNGS